MSTTTLQVNTFLPYLRDVLRCDESLRELNLTWRMLEANARMNCAHEARDILPMMAATREGFEQLEQGLVGSLVGERVSTVLQTVGIKARHVVDIVVRNLYERTADVGFLATDRDLCEFLARGADGDVVRARRRLQAYRDKYTVYDDILLLDAQGQVMVRIDETVSSTEPGLVRVSHDPLIAETLRSDDFVETFRASDLRPGKRQALIYSKRMRGPDGRVVGLLCLSFDFEHEMAGIFRSRRDAEERAVMLLIDGDQRVVASADELWIPPGTVVPVNHDEEARLVVFSGREYLVQTYRPHGYQGYPGPEGWQGQVMIPVDVAFSAARTAALDGLSPRVVQGLLTHARHFCPPLFEIVNAAQSIRRVVWNGQVMTARQGREQHKLKALLAQVSETGARTNALFSQSIRDLYDTVLSAAMRRGEFVTRLQVDLLDRNLYERSDDCRWWALTPELRQALAGGADAPSMTAIGEILQKINSLYTVYTRLVVYDREGRIVAASHPATQDSGSVVGLSIESDTLAAVLALGSAQRYHVTPFREAVLYDDRATYVYHAAIRHPDHDDEVVGGIGIVFDAQPEFHAMLCDAMEGQGKQCQAFFITRQGQVISSMDPAVPVGSQLEVAADLLALPSAGSAARIVEHQGQYAVLAVSASSGYREFKVSDGYREDVLAVMFDPLGAVMDSASPGDARQAEDVALSQELQNGEQFATVFIEGQLYALPAGDVLEALPGDSIAPVSAGKQGHRLGAVTLRNQGEPAVVWVYDLLGLTTGTPTRDLASAQVVVVRLDGVARGLLVSSLHGVPEFLPTDILPVTRVTTHGWVSRMISVKQGRLLIPVLNLRQLLTQWIGLEEVRGAAEPVPAAATSATTMAEWAAQQRAAVV